MTDPARLNVGTDAEMMDRFPWEVISSGGWDGGVIVYAANLLDAAKEFNEEYPGLVLFSVRMMSDNE